MTDANALHLYPRGTGISARINGYKPERASMDDWNLKSTADQRVWALGVVGIGIRCGEATTAEAIAAAEALLAYINGPVTSAPDTERQSVEPLSEAA